MPVSEKQLTANRANAQKSTGPQTPEGKSIVAQNAFKHGLTASDDLVIKAALASEDKTEYENLFEALTEELKPTTPFQTHLVQRITNCLWRSRRIVVAETAEISDRLSYINPEFELYQERPEKLIYTINSNSVPSPTVSSHLHTYEMRLDRQLIHTLSMLKLIQAEPIEKPKLPTPPSATTSLLSNSPENCNDQ